MKLEIYSMFDRVAGQYGSPFLQNNQGEAKRKFNYVVLQTPMVAGDLDLFLIGYFDTETGIISPCSQPQFICHSAGIEEEYIYEA